MSGAAGRFAEVYGEVLESPREFLYLAFLTGLGTLLYKLTLASELKVQPRLYTLLLGQSADDRKSTALDKTVEFFQNYSKQFQICRGVGSAEGCRSGWRKYWRVAAGLGRVQPVHTKANIEGSVLGRWSIPL
jgi:hypothetical protein